MAIERTLSIIKPDGVKNNVIGNIIAKFEESGLTPVAIRMTHLSQAEAEGFYAVHKERPFFGELVEFMTSGPVVLMVLEGEDAIAKNREVMGATNPADAAEGTIRKLYAASIGENTVHGSDAPETAVTEIGYFFRGVDIFPKAGPPITANP
ncbi:MAG: nucleoside-diphosphate kinase [Myxococcota bacterium]